MRSHGPIEFRRLRDVNPADLIDLMNDPRVRRHLPLAKGPFGPRECERFVAAKERLWAEHGYGPWAFYVGEDFAGWGGLQPEGADADVGMILRPEFWGLGRALYREILAYAFDTLGVPSVIALLPPSRTRIRGVLGLGFVEDGEVELGGQRFLRFRLSRAVSPAGRGRTR